MRCLSHFTRLLGVGVVFTLFASSVGYANDLTDLAKVKASGQLKVALYKDNAPFSDGPTSDFSGLDVDIGRGLAQKLGLKFSPLPFDAGESMNDDLRNMVWRGHYLGYGPGDVFLHVPVDKFLVNQNRQTMIFAPYYRETLVVLHARATVVAIRSADDLQGLAIAVERGSGAASAIVGYKGGSLREKVKIVANGIDAAQAVVDGTVAAAYVTRAQAEYVLHRAKAQTQSYAISSITLPGLQENGWIVGIAVKADHKELGLALESALKSMRESGELVQLFKNYGMTLSAP